MGLRCLSADGQWEWSPKTYRWHPIGVTPSIEVAEGSPSWWYRRCHEQMFGVENLRQCGRPAHERIDQLLDEWGCPVDPELRAAIHRIQSEM